MSIQSAINCLDENIRLYGNPRVDPEKYNLYNGLSEMARAIQRLDNEVEVIKNTVNGILHEVRRVQSLRRLTAKDHTGLLLPVLENRF